MANKTDKKTKKEIKRKTININNTKNYGEDQEEVIRFIRLIIIILVVVLGVYLFSRAFISKDLFGKKEEERESVEGTVNYNTTIIGAMLNKPEEEYYVIMYDTETSQAAYYSNLVTAYKKNTEPLKIYMADLNNELNKKYISEKNHLKVSNINDLTVKDIGLVKIKNGAIIASYNTIDEISKELEYKKDAKNN